MHRRSYQAEDVATRRLKGRNLWQKHSLFTTETQLTTRPPRQSPLGTARDAGRRRQTRRNPGTAAAGASSTVAAPASRAVPVPARRALPVAGSVPEGNLLHGAQAEEFLKLQEVDYWIN